MVLGVGFGVVTGAVGVVAGWMGVVVEGVDSRMLRLGAIFKDWVGSMGDSTSECILLESLGMRFEDTHTQL